MGTLNLDLDDAFRKFHRGMEHMKAFDAEFRRIIKERSPFSIRPGEVDPDGWMDIFIHTAKLNEPRLSILYGDVLHNLRSSLDYIVTALAQASGITDEFTRNGFPIRESQSNYEEYVVGKNGRAKRGGPLEGITVGLDDIELFQPYRLKPEPRRHALYILNWQENTDKHSRLTLNEVIPREAKLIVAPRPGSGSSRIIDRQEATPEAFEAGTNQLMARVRLSTPVKTVLDYHFEVDGAPMMLVPLEKATRDGLQRPEPNAIPAYVRRVLDHFAAL